MLIDYIEKKLKSAHYQILEDKTFFGEISGLDGVWANAKTLEECREELREVLEDWLLIKIQDGDSIPGLKVPSPLNCKVKNSFAYA